MASRLCASWWLGLSRNCDAATLAAPFASGAITGGPSCQSTASSFAVDWQLGPPVSAEDANGGTRVAASQLSEGENPREAQSLDAIQREHIIAMLRKSYGVVEGPNGAAQLLEMNPSTVRFRMKKLGISKAEYLADLGSRSRSGSQ